MQKQIRLLAIVPSGVCFGLQNITFSFFNRFSENLLPHFLITRCSDGEFAQRLDQLGIKYSYSWWQMFAFSLRPSNLKMAMLTLLRLPGLYYDYFKVLRRFRPDLLFFANHHELLLFFPVLLFRRVPLICHMHDPFPPTRLQRLSFKIYGRNVDHFICISESVRQRLIALGCPPEKTTLIYNGIEIKNIAPRTGRTSLFQLPEQTIAVGISGQMTATKGHLDLLRAAVLLKDRCPQLHFVIGGKPGGEYYDSLVKYVADHQLQSRVTFAGWQPDAAAFFRAIDIFTLLTRHDEGFGLVVAEAMIHGLPVVATRSGGVVEVVDEGRTGFLIDKNSPGQLADQLAWLCDHPAERQQMGREGQAHIAQKFDISVQAADFERFLVGLQKN